MLWPAALVGAPCARRNRTSCSPAVGVPSAWVGQTATSSPTAAAPCNAAMGTTIQPVVEVVPSVRLASDRNRACVTTAASLDKSASSVAVGTEQPSNEVSPPVHATIAAVAATATRVTIANFDDAGDISVRYVVPSRARRWQPRWGSAVCSPYQLCGSSSAPNRKSSAR